MKRIYDHRLVIATLQLCYRSCIPGWKINGRKYGREQVYIHIYTFSSNTGEMFLFLTKAPSPIQRNKQALILFLPAATSLNHIFPDDNARAYTLPVEYLAFTNPSFVFTLFIALAEFWFYFQKFWILSIFVLILSEPINGCTIPLYTRISYTFPCNLRQVSIDWQSITIYEKKSPLFFR